MKNSNLYIYQNCKSARKARRHREYRRWSTYIVVLYAIFSSAMAYNSYCNLISDITATHYATEPIQAVNAQTMPTNAEDIIKLVAEKNNFEDVQLLLDIARCESSMNYRAYNVNKNGTIDMGLYEFNSIHGFGEKPLDPYWATQKAIDWIRGGKLNAWYSSRKCWQK